jgi:hypothetical protein
MKLSAMGFLILLVWGCAEKPDPDARAMVTRNMTRVYYYAFIEPRTIAVLDEGDTVQAQPTKDGWYKIWWRGKTKWKTGFAKSADLRPVEPPDTLSE